METRSLEAILGNAPQLPRTPYPDGLTPIGSKGPRNAKLVVIGEAPGAEEARAGVPFVGASGKELDKMLADAGINPAEVYYTNVTLVRPPDNDIKAWVQQSKTRSTRGKRPTPEHWVQFRGWWVEPHVREDTLRLYEELRSIKPNAILAVGQTPFWALCAEGTKSGTKEGSGKVGTWRGSTLLSDVLEDVKVIPAYHPAFILRQWQHRTITVQDFRRAGHAARTKGLSPPPWDFVLSPTFDQAASFLSGILERLSAGEVRLTCDVEVSQKKCLCVGIGTSRYRAISIPFLYKWDFYFPPDQHWVIVNLLRKVLTHPNARVWNQNIGYDIQFLVNDFLIYPNVAGDTMINQNVLFPGTPMNLGYQASMYCGHYRYWKDDGKFWKLPEIQNWEQLWFYNCEDAARTYEVMECQEAMLQHRKLVPQRDLIAQRFFPLIRKAMFRGVNVDTAKKRLMLRELYHVTDMAQAKVNYFASKKLDVSSPQQLANFFYFELKLPKQFNQKKGEAPSLSCDANALVTLAKIEPLIGELVRWINIARSYIAAIKVCNAEVDEDGRWRCSYSFGIVETLRLSSSENPYGRGLNLMNISSGKEVKDADED